MAAVTNLCRTCILLGNGQIQASGKVGNIIDEYLAIVDSGNIYRALNNSDKEIFIESAELSFISQRVIEIRISMYSSLESRCSIDLRFKTRNGLPVGFGSIGTFDENKIINVKQGINSYKLKFSVENWAIGKYFVSMDITRPDVMYYERLENFLMFELVRKSDTNRRVLDLNWNYGPFQIAIEKD